MILPEHPRADAKQISDIEVLISPASSMMRVDIPRFAGFPGQVEPIDWDDVSTGSWTSKGG